MMETSPGSLTYAIPMIWEDLPELCGDGWSRIRWQLWTCLGDLEDGKPGATDAILSLLEPFPSAMAKLESAIEKQKLDKAAPAGTLQMKRYEVVPVFCATDRKPEHKGYGTEHVGDDSLSFGVVRVSIPAEHARGKREHPPFWKLGFGWDPTKHVQLLTVERLDQNSYISRARETLETADPNEALIFIHGYNVTFDEAARHAAQVTYDLEFGGLAMLYSWASKGAKGAYFKDADKVELTELRLTTFLILVMTRLGLDRVHILAHSMGSRALTSVLTELEPETLGDGTASLGQVFFAAPDVNAQRFKDRVAGFWEKVSRCTLYASSADVPLKLSKEFNDSARAGDAGVGLVITEGVDTIDATYVDGSLLGHSYFGTSRSVRTDIERLIRHDEDPDERGGLKGYGPPDRRYWIFPK